MRFAGGLISATLFVACALPVCAGGAQARQRSRAKKGAAVAKSKPQAQPVSELARLRAQYVEATREVKASLARELDLYKPDVERADERVTKTLELYRAGLVSKLELEREELAAEQARAKIAAIEGRLKNADVQIAETLVEAEAEEAAAKALAQARTAPRAAGGVVQTTAYTRYGGARAWSINEAGSVMQFYARSFGRQLPVSSFGQSPVHDRWGYAHHNAMDVGVNPDSAEGRALMEYLRSSGIPFTAFRFAIPGTATGPHIHIGRPSHKISPR